MDVIVLTKTKDSFRYEKQQVLYITLPVLENMKQLNV
jgi:hypothetical protein